MHILTITPNPAIDQTIAVDRLIPGQVHRATAVCYNAGGKGVNVSSCLADWGLPSAVSGFLGRGNAGLFEALVQAKGLEDRFIRLAGSSRINIKVVDQAGATDINLPGAEVDGGQVAALEALVQMFFWPGPGLAVMAGSLPPGCPEDLYQRLLAGLQGRGVRVVLDAAGPALTRALAGGAPPFAVKPNVQELGQWAGRELGTLAEVVAQARALRQQGVSLVAVSRGEEGAVLAGPEGVLTARGRAENVGSTVGAGDAMVAGLVAALAEGADLERTARLATAFALAKLGLPGPNLPSRAAVEDMARQVEVNRINAA